MIDRVAARDAAIHAILPLIPAKGWTAQAARQACGDDAALLFPGGSADIVDAYLDLADRNMVAVALPILVDQKLSLRVRALIATRLEQALPHREAVRRAAALLAWPANTMLAARCTYRTVDTIWRAAEDSSVGVSWYTKRAILAGVYTSTLMYWLDMGRDQADTLDFLDRRLAGVARLGRLRRQITERLAG